MQNAGEARANPNQGAETPSVIMQLKSTFVPQAPPLLFNGAFSLPPPPNCLFLGTNMLGGTKPRPEVDELQDPSLSIEDRKEKLFAFIKKQKETIDGLVSEEIEKTLTLNDSQAFQTELDKLLEKIKGEQRALSNMAKTYLKLVTNISDLEQKLNANKDAPRDFDVLQRQSDILKSSLEPVAHEIHAFFSDEPLQLAKVEKEWSRTERKCSENILALKGKLKTNAESIDPLYNGKRTLDQIEIDPTKPNMDSHQKVLTKNKKIISDKIDVLLKEREYLKLEIEKQILLFGTKQMENSLLFGGLYAPINDFSKKICSIRRKSNALFPRARIELSRSAREQEFTVFIKNGCSNNTEAEPEVELEVKGKKTLSRPTILESIKEHIKSTMTESDLLFMRDQHPDIFSCDTYALPSIIEELSLEILNCCVENSMTTPTGAVVILPLKKPAIAYGDQIREAMERTNFTDATTGDKLSLEDLETLYPATSNDHDIDGDEDLLRAMGVNNRPISRLGARK